MNIKNALIGLVMLSPFVGKAQTDTATVKADTLPTPKVVVFNPGTALQGVTTDVFSVTGHGGNNNTFTQNLAGVTVAIPVDGVSDAIDGKVTMVGGAGASYVKNKAGSIGGDYTLIPRLEGGLVGNFNKLKAFVLGKTTFPSKNDVAPVNTATAGVIYSPTPKTAVSAEVERTMAMDKTLPGEQSMLPSTDRLYNHYSDVTTIKGAITYGLKKLSNRFSDNEAQFFVAPTVQGQVEFRPHGQATKASVQPGVLFSIKKNFWKVVANVGGRFDLSKDPNVKRAILVGGVTASANLTNPETTQKKQPRSWW